MTADPTPIAATLPSDAVGLDEVHALVERFWHERSPGSETDRVAFELALVEIAGNAIQHGSGEPFTVTLRTDGAAVVAELREPGERLPDAVVDERRLPGDDAEGGRGIPLARAAVDELRYSHADGVNRWTIVRTPRA